MRSFGHQSCLATSTAAFQLVATLTLWIAQTIPELIGLLHHVRHTWPSEQLKTLAVAFLRPFVCPNLQERPSNHNSTALKQLGTYAFGAVSY